MKLPHKTLERKLFASGYSLIFAVDEVGMGCLAGPVVVCAVGFRKKFFNRKHKEYNRLRDSKLLAANQREEYANKLMADKDIQFQVAYAHPKTVDKLNVYNAARLTMKRAIQKLLTNSKFQTLLRQAQDSEHSRTINSKQIHNSKPKIQNKTIVLVDGKTFIKGLNIGQMPVVKGDRKIFAIACASIIAKVHRDKMMARYAKKYLGYGFEKHKGYGTKYHQAQLVTLGPCEIHRKSFRLIY